MNFLKVVETGREAGKLLLKTETGEAIDFAVAPTLGVPSARADAGNKARAPRAFRRRTDPRQGAGDRAVGQRDADPSRECVVDNRREGGTRQSRRHRRRWCGSRSIRAMRIFSLQMRHLSYPARRHRANETECGTRPDHGDVWSMEVMMLHFKTKMKSLAIAASLMTTVCGPALAQTAGQRRRLCPGFAWAEPVRGVGDREDAGAARLREEGRHHRQHGICRRGDGAAEGAPRPRQRHRQIRPGDARQRRRRADLSLCRLSRAARRLLDKATDYFDAAKVYPQFLDANRVERQALGAALLFVRRRRRSTARTSSTNTASPEFPKTTEELEKALQTVKEGLAKDGITDMYALTMRGAPGEEPSLDLAGFVYAYAGYPRLVRGRRRQRPRRSRRRRPSRSSPATSSTASRPSSAGRRSSVRRASPPTPGST